jgi:hypothetical protein
MKRYDVLLEDWDKVLSFFSHHLGIYEIDLEGVLFLIGINVLGKGPEKFNKREKMEIIHIAVCELLVPFGYYERVSFSHVDWPVYRAKRPLPALSITEQERLIKMAIIDYLQQEGLIDCND